MSSLSEQDPLNPNDPEFYAPPLLRERAAKLARSLSQEARSEPIRSSPISRPASLQDQDNDNDALWNPLAPEVIYEPAGLAWDRRTAQLAVAAAVAGVVTVAVLLFVLMKPAPPLSVAGSTSSDITGSMSTALAQPGQGDVGSKPALEEFKALLASPPSQPATQEQSQQLLQDFLQWRKKASTTEKSQ
jgi:hypothetical protein